MNYNILIAIIIIIMSICVYNYFNVSQEGNTNKDPKDPKDYERGSVLYGELLKEVKRDKKNINQLKKNNIKYNEILDCLTYRQEGFDAKKKHAQSGKTKQSTDRKNKINNSAQGLKNLKF